MKIAVSAVFVLCVVMSAVTQSVSDSIISNTFSIKNPENVSFGGYGRASAYMLGRDYDYTTLFSEINLKAGMNTELGKIASMIQQAEDLTPLQKRIDKLGKIIALIAVFACAIVLIVGVSRGAEPMHMLIVALALAVAAVPEGLPLTMTLSLSFGMRKMAEKNAIVRRMMAVETLGSATVICSDKTGTLTLNQMTVERIFCAGSWIDVRGSGYEPKGEFRPRA